MKRLTLLALLVLAPLGCKKALDKIGDDAKPGENEQPRVVPKGTGDLSGGGGATQSVRKAAARTVNDHYLSQLHQMIVATMTEDVDGRVPDANRIMEEIKNVGPLNNMVKDEIVILTNNRDPQGIWAYTKWPQRAGKHYVITASGRGEMSPAELTRALETQRSTVKLEK